ncbi:MAG: mechanosensitive ion channel family protein [Planctomycetota bacterium]
MSLFRLLAVAVALTLATPALSQEPATADEQAPAVEETASGLTVTELPDATDVPADVDPDAFLLMLKPLDAEELDAVAEAWKGRLEQLTREVAELRLASLDATGDVKMLLVEEATQRTFARDQVGDRLGDVLAALEAKGGDPSDRLAYLDAVTATDFDPFDFEALWPAIKAWLLNPNGGIAIGLAILYFLVILILAWFVAKILSGIVRKALGGVKGASQLLKDFLAGLVRKIVMVVGFVVALSFLGVNIAPLVAAIGAAGLVVGLALQGTLSNFASGILILLYRPYDVGDVINAGGVTGKVDAMSLVSTTVITPDNQKIVAPNNSIWGDTITNITGLPTRRVDMTFGVGYGDDLDKVMETLAQVCSEHEQVLDDPAPVIKVTGHGDSAVDVICRPWVKTEDYWGVYWDFHKTVKQKFDAAGINIPFPQRDVHMITA